jgi:hypothetical protein
MTTGRRKGGALLLAALAACGVADAKGPETARPEPHVAQLSQAAHGTVVVSIVVDQLAAWVLASRLNELPRDGGFARLLREGTYARDMRYMHAATDTAPGHSSLYTGKTPRESGIFANEVPGDEKPVSVLRDNTTSLVTEDGVMRRPGSSIARLRVPTVADELRAKDPSAFIVSISLKDRGAIFGGGRHPNATLWLDVEADGFASSTAFTNVLPPWTAHTGGRVQVGKARRHPWTMIDPAWVQAHAATQDNQPGEGDLDGLGTVFPHVAKTARAFRATPFSDAQLIDIALAALHDPAAQGHTTLLALSFSANDYIGHAFGPDSWEAWEELHSLDRSLATFFTALDSLYGEGGYAVVLSSDHGTFTMPEAATVKGTQPWCTSGGEDAWQRPCGAGHRVIPYELGRAMEVAASAAIGDGPWIDGVADPYYFLTQKAKDLPEATRAKLDAALLQGIVQHIGPALDHVVSRSELTRTCTGASSPWDESIPTLVCNSFTDTSGDGYIVLKPGSFFDGGVVVGKGTSHGSPYAYDRSVPFIVSAKGRAHAGLSVNETVRFSAFSSVLRSLLGITSTPVDDAIRVESRSH